MTIPEIPERDRPHQIGMFDRAPISCPCCGAPVDRLSIRNTLVRVPPALMIACGTCHAPLTLVGGFVFAIIGGVFSWCIAAAVCHFTGHSIGLIPLGAFCLGMIACLFLSHHLAASRWERSWAWMKALKTPPLSSAEVTQRRYALEKAKREIMAGFAPAGLVESSLKWIEEQQMRLEENALVRP